MDPAGRKGAGGLWEGDGTRPGLSVARPGWLQPPGRADTPPGFPAGPLPPAPHTTGPRGFSLVVVIAQSLDVSVFFGSWSVTLTFHPPSSFPSQIRRLYWGLFLQAPRRGK